MYCEGKGVSEVDFEEANKVTFPPGLLLRDRPPGTHAHTEEYHTTLTEAIENRANIEANW